MAEINELLSPKAEKQITTLTKGLIAINTELTKISKSWNELNKETKKAGKNEKELDSITKEGNKLLAKRNDIVVKSDKLLEAQTKELIKAQEAEKKRMAAIKESVTGEKKAIEIKKQRIAAAKRAIIAAKQEKKEIFNLTKELRKEVNTERQATEQNKKLLNARKQINASTKKGALEVKLINKQIDRNNALLKRNASQLGKQKIGIGQYDKATKGLKGSLQKVGKAALSYGAAFLGINAAMKLGKSAFDLFFAGTRNSADRLRIKMAGLKAQFDLLKDSVANLGDSGGDAVEELSESIDLPTTKFGFILRLMADFAKRGLLGQEKASELMMVGDAAKILEARLIKLERAEADLSLIYASRRRIIADLRLLAESDNETYDDRIEALKLGMKLEKQIDDDRSKAQRERISISLAEKTITDEQINAIVEQGLAIEKVGLTLSTEKERVAVIGEIRQFYEDQTQSLLKQKKLLANINMLVDERRARESVILKAREKETEIDESVIKRKEDIGRGELTITQSHLDARLTVIEDAADEEVRIEQEKQDRINAIRQASFQAAQSIGNSLFEIGQNRRDAEMIALNADYARRIELAGDDTERKEALEDELEEKQKQIKLKQFKAEKNQALFNIQMSTAQSIASSAQIGFPLAIPFIALSAAMGIAQTAAVLSRPIPAFFDGTSDTPLEFTAGEKGSELMIKKDGSVELTPDRTTLYKGKEHQHATIIPNQETQKILAHNGINGDPEMIKELRLTRKAIENSGINVNIARNMPKINLGYIKRKHKWSVNG